jgi:hypothetical protein
MSDTKVGVPSAASMKDAAMYGVYGAAGALLFQLVSKYTGSGILGALIAIAVTGGVLKGEAGKTVSAMIGYNMVMSGAFSLGSLGGGTKSTERPVT